MVEQPEKVTGKPSSRRQGTHAKRFDSPQEGTAELARILQMATEHQAGIREQIETALAPLQKEFDDLRAGAEVHRSDIQDKASLNNRLTSVSDRLKRLEESWSSEAGLVQKLQKESVNNFHELEKQRLVDEKNVENWRYFGKVAMPLLSGAVVALFGWVWTSHTALVLLQNEFNTATSDVRDDLSNLAKRIEVNAGNMGNRFTRDAADTRFAAVARNTSDSVSESEQRVGQMIDHLREDTKDDLVELSKRIDGLDQRLRAAGGAMPGRLSN